MRAALAATCIGVVISAGAALGSTPAGTALRITYWEDSANASSSVTWTLRCDPARGTLGRPARACARLAAGGTKVFAPLPPNVVCTEIYGGPQKARVVGVVDGKHVWSTFTRTNGCQIGRWQRISPWLVPPGGVAS